MVQFPAKKKLRFSKCFIAKKCLLRFYQENSVSLRVFPFWLYIVINVIVKWSLAVVPRSLYQQESFVYISSLTTRTIVSHIWEILQESCLKIWPIFTYDSTCCRFNPLVAYVSLRWKWNAVISAFYGLILSVWLIDYCKTRF